MSVVALVGATATGKSALAVAVTHALRDRGIAAEIVNADSMLVYRGMDIGTAKPTMAERAGIPHHLIDIYPVTKAASVAEFQALARERIQSLQADDKVAVLVGGSALYSRAILDHFDFPGSEPGIRARWQAELERVGAPALHRKLQELAPDSAQQIEPGNGRRIVRALEVHELTGGHRAQLPQWTYALPGVRQFGLELDRDLLDERIALRVGRMWEQGLVNEVAGLLDQGLRDGLTASRAIGYRQVIAMLDGVITELEAQTEVVRATKRFFRKQLSWYRRDSRIHWLPALAKDNAEQIADQVEFQAEQRS